MLLHRLPRRFLRFVRLIVAQQRLRQLAPATSALSGAIRAASRRACYRLARLVVDQCQGAFDAQPFHPIAARPPASASAMDSACL